MQRMRKVCHSQCMGFSVSLLLQTHTRTNFTVPEVHFHAEAIGASPVVTGRKTAKLSKFLHSQTQRDPTIVAALVEHKSWKGRMDLGHGPRECLISFFGADCDQGYWLCVIEYILHSH